jgi:hypothetical protein
MNKETLKEIIDSILEEKEVYIKEEINMVEEKFITLLQNLKELNKFQKYDLPDDLLKREAPPSQNLDILHDYTDQLSNSVNQLKLIQTLLQGINNFCSRAAIFLLRDDKLVGWDGCGFSGKQGEIDNKEIKKIFISLSANTTFKTVLNTKKGYYGDPHKNPDNHLIFSRFGATEPGKVFILPFFVKGKPQAVIYTDSTEGESSIEEKPIEILSRIGEMSLDLLPLRQKLMTRVKTQKFMGDPDEKTVVDGAVRDTLDESGEQSEDEIDFVSLKKADPQRLARVTINDIVLYNKKKVEEARKNKNIYKALKDTILQARESYLFRFDDLSYFENELIKTLAKGDKEALDGYEFETL